MGNNMACKIVGIGTIQIKMFDGIVRTTCSKVEEEFNFFGYSGFKWLQVFC